LEAPKDLYTRKHFIEYGDRMTLTIGDHVVIKRDGVVLDESFGEAYHEFEVLDITVSGIKDSKTVYTVKLKVIA